MQLLLQNVVAEAVDLDDHESGLGRVDRVRAAHPEPPDQGPEMRVAFGYRKNGRQDRVHDREDPRAEKCRRDAADLDARDHHAQDQNRCDLQGQNRG